MQIFAPYVVWSDHENRLFLEGCGHPKNQYLGFRSSFWRKMTYDDDYIRTSDEMSGQ